MKAALHKKYLNQWLKSKIISGCLEQDCRRSRERWTTARTFQGDENLLHLDKRTRFTGVYQKAQTGALHICIFLYINFALKT